MPVAGSYRAIDFALSNMTNSHIQKVAVLTQYNARSPERASELIEMVGFRKESRADCTCLPRRSQRTTATGIGELQMRSIRDLDFLRRCHEPYVIITIRGCSIQDGLQTRSWNTILRRKPISLWCARSLNREKMRPGSGTIRMNEASRIEEFEEKPMVAHSQTISHGDLHHPKKTAHRSDRALRGGRATRFCDGYPDQI